MAVAAAKNGLARALQYHGAVLRPRSYFLLMIGFSLSLGLAASARDARGQNQPRTRPTPPSRRQRPACELCAAGCKKTRGRLQRWASQRASRPQKPSPPPEPAAYEVLFTFDDGPAWIPRPRCWIRSTSTVSKPSSS